MNHWTALCEPVTPPPWHGARRLYRLLGDDPEPTPKPRRRAIKPWTLIVPGSDMERAILALPQNHYWKVACA